MRAVLITILAAAIVGGGSVFAWLYYGGFNHERDTAVAFIDVYSRYDELATNLEILVHLPGLEENSDRAELLALLESMLTDSLDDARRDTLARLAYANLDTLRKGIDAATRAQEEMYKELQNLDNAARLFQGIEVRRKAGVVVDQARKRAELSSRITLLLTEMNDQMNLIITRILEEGGSLSPEHITSINDTTDAAEQRFATLSGLYEELIAHNKVLDTTFRTFVDHVM